MIQICESLGAHRSTVVEYPDGTILQKQDHLTVIASGTSDQTVDVPPESDPRDGGQAGRLRRPLHHDGSGKFQKLNGALECDGQPPLPDVGESAWR